MSNWDDEDFEAPAAKIAGEGSTFTEGWEGEDEDVKDDWDASSGDEKKAAADAAPTLVKKKKTLQDKIKEREERARELQQKKAEAEKIYTEAEKRKMQEEADLAVAQDALGVTDLSQNLKEMGLLEKFEPTCLKDFVEFRFQLTQKLLNYKDSPHYYLFIEDLFRDLASGLNAEDTRKLSNMLLASSNEKTKREKGDQKKGKGKSTKKSMKQVGSAIDEYGKFGDGDADGDEYDDFI